ncbi:uncharacterized protein LODBEIA_P60790 [Lodderomyces beijingensis]|uniref:Uncharacterized protein n=1 Tax=Lodderomyces beijingensis TaxID=1775926 RepID=A0ABP0ZW44_9ASCO
MKVRQIQYITTSISSALAIASGVLVILRSRTELYHLMHAIAAFVLPSSYIPCLLLTNPVTIVIQASVSIFYIVSGILLILLWPYDVVTILFATSIVFATASFASLLPRSLFTYEPTDEEMRIAKKPSDATLIEQMYAFDTAMPKQKQANKEPGFAYPTGLDLQTNIGSQKMATGRPFGNDNNDHNDDNARRPSKPSSIPGSLTSFHAPDYECTKQILEKQRLQLIDREKQFISNISESLLPAVLKTCNKASTVEDYTADLLELQQVTGFQSDITPSITAFHGYSLQQYSKTKFHSGYNISPQKSRISLEPSFDKQDDGDGGYHQSALSPVETPNENSDAQSQLTHSCSAPSLQTFRKESNNSVSSPAPSEDHLPQVDEVQPEPSTPLGNLTPDFASKNGSAIRRLFQSGSPKKVFRSKTMEFSSLHHKHSTSMISNTQSLKSAFSSRSKPSSPRKLKSFLKIHKHSSSVPNLAAWSPTHILTPSESSTNYHFPTSSSSPQHTIFPHSVHSSRQIEPIDLWDVNTVNYDYDATEAVAHERSGNLVVVPARPAEGESRVSSLPSQVIGEYDREKWNTIKQLAQAQEDELN